MRCGRPPGLAKDSLSLRGCSVLSILVDVIPSAFRSQSLSQCPQNPAEWESHID